MVLLLISASCWAQTDIVPAGPAARPGYAFSPEDEKLLEEVQRGCFLYFWNEVGTPSGLAKDRKLSPVASVAAVGFQLSSLPIGVEHKWIRRQQGEDRAKTVLRTLLERKDNKRFGVLLHFPDLNTGGISHEGFELNCSTVDHALLAAGAITAGQYFGGEVAALTDRLLDNTDWKAFAVDRDGYVSMGWRPDNKNDMQGPGKFLELHWWVASDEERLVYLLAAGAPPEHRVDPAMYYKLKRNVKSFGDQAPFVVSWGGVLFNYFFSHCWIDYRSLGPDDPAAFGVRAAPRVDWFENSRRAVLSQRARCIDAKSRFKTFAENRWGLSACDGREGYIVPGLKPNIDDKDEWHEGTVAPYAAGASIIFAPVEAMAALREFRSLKDDQARSLIWRDAAAGGYGFVDAFNLDQNWVSADYIGIDVGPMLLAIENVRTGLIWKLFKEHPVAQRGLGELKLLK